MAAVQISALFCLVMSVCGASRNERVAGGRPVVRRSELKYPWIVYIFSVYAYKTEDGEIRETCEFECTGSFIDRYGSVVTAAHCLYRYTDCIDHVDNVTRTCQLYYVNVTWGILSPTYNRYTTEKVDSNVNLIPFSGSEEGRPVDVDIALIYLNKFQEKPMACKPESAPRPITLDRPVSRSRNNPRSRNMQRSRNIQTSGNSPRSRKGPRSRNIPQSRNKQRSQTMPLWRRVGIFAGFGAQPRKPKSGCQYCYRSAKHLSQITMRYDKEFEQSPLCNRSYCFNAYAEIIEPPPDSSYRHPQIGGTCGGDSGGPYMVKEPYGDRRMILRGTLIGGWAAKSHDCSGWFHAQYFVTISSKIVRSWLLSALKARYHKRGLNTNIVPATCKGL